ncbi:MAG: LLM class flavin-dependent oxidoreductase [Candidatus Binataceae bacterium]|nr:LLM class flavin-dependent oxidoreductase [Candidatus Binataceae bacterium]
MASIGLFSEGSLTPGRSPHPYYRELGEQIVMGDRLGFDFFSTTQSYGLDHADSTFSVVPDPLALFLAQTARTERIKVLTGITIAPFHHPAMALSDFAAADVLSGGRVMIGIGRGHPWLYERLGLDQNESKARASEFCSMVRTILDAPHARHTIGGTFWRMHDFELLPQFIQPHPEVYFAVSISPSSAVEAASHRFGILIPAYLGTPIEAVEMLIKTYREEYRKLWNDPGKILLGVNFYGLPDERAAIAMGARGLAMQMKVFARNMIGYTHKFGEQYSAYREIGSLFEAMSDPKVCESRVLAEFPRYLAFWGNRDTLDKKMIAVIERLRPDSLALNIDCGGIPLEATAASMRFFAAELMPSIRHCLDRAV